MQAFTPVSAFFGGVMIGLSAVGLMFLNGRIAGISGIVGAVPAAGAADAGWRLAFIAGLIAGPFVLLAIQGALPPVVVDVPMPAVVAGGLLVGFGTRLGSGCTSGHGVCGLARLSPRSIVATAVFTGTAMATVALVRHGLGS
ncbi:MAG: YeeE/YedE family protein [Rhodospirillales bacterium]|nr:YeeE/YedE family protein [Rhodospirillales bacterium]